MLLALRHPVYRRLLGAYLLSLIGTGLATISVGFLAFEAAGEGAAVVIGALYTVKIFVTLVVAPFAPLVAARFGPRRLLVVTDATRAAIAVVLPFVTDLTLAFALIVVLQSASALFSPTYQAMIPRVLTDDREYTGALALYRLGYDLDMILTPAIAGALLLVVTAPSLFWGTAAGFLASALLILATAIPPPPTHATPMRARTRFANGFRLMFSRPALRGVVAFSLSLALSGSVVLVLTIPLALGPLGAGEAQATLLLTAFGLGSITAAVAMPRLIVRTGTRRFMLIGAVLLASATLLLWPALLLFGVHGDFAAVCALWFVGGAGYSMLLSPVGRVLRDSVPEADLPDVFAAQFTLTHAGWLFTYAGAGILGATIGIAPASTVLAAASVLALVLAARAWKRAEDRALASRRLTGEAPRPRASRRRTDAHRTRRTPVGDGSSERSHPDRTR